MNTFDAYEQAYRNGYKSGFTDGTKGFARNQFGITIWLVKPLNKIQLWLLKIFGIEFSGFGDSN